MNLEEISLKKDNKNFFSRALKKIRSKIMPLALSSLIFFSCNTKFVDIPDPKGPYFSIVVLPDTQYYMESYPEIFNGQIEWINENKEKYNIGCVLHLGDIVQNADVIEEWDNAKNGVDLLDKDIPLLLSVGNHDSYPKNDPDRTENYNDYFGGYMRSDENKGFYSEEDVDNSYMLFDHDGEKFIAISIEYDPSIDSSVMDWADEVAQNYPDRKAIIVSHAVIEDVSRANFSKQGQAIYDKFKDNENVFLILTGNKDGETYRKDYYRGNIIYSMLSNYQCRKNGGNGWLRILKFFPESNKIKAETYSSYLKKFEKDFNSEFLIDWE